MAEDQKVPDSAKSDIRKVKASLAEGLDGALDYLIPKVEGQSRHITRHAERLTKHDEQFLQLARMEKQLKHLKGQCECLLKADFAPDPWLAAAKDKHQGERCFLLGCGPSIERTDLSKLASEHTMGVNGICLIENFQLEYFCTVAYNWWQSHEDAVRNYRCARRFLPPYLPELDSDSPTSWLNVLESNSYEAPDKPAPWFFSKEADRLILNSGTVLFVCMQLLYHLGFAEVILLGADHDYGLSEEEKARGSFMLPIENVPDSHFRQDYFKPGEQIHFHWAALERSYKLAHQAYLADGRKIINASISTKLETFPRAKFDSLF